VITAIATPISHSLALSPFHVQLPTRQQPRLFNIIDDYRGFCLFCNTSIFITEMIKHSLARIQLTMDLSTDIEADGDVERLVEGIHGEAIEGTPGEAMSQPLNCFIA
jgi:hypothetical protein